MVSYPCDSLWDVLFIPNEASPSANTVGNPMPESTLTLCQSLLLSSSRGLRIWPLYCTCTLSFSCAYMHMKNSIYYNWPPRRGNNSRLGYCHWKHLAAFFSQPIILCVSVTRLVGIWVAYLWTQSQQQDVTLAHRVHIFQEMKQG